MISIYGSKQVEDMSNMTSLGNITFAGWVIFFHYFLSDVSNECSTLVCYHVCVCQSRESNSVYRVTHYRECHLKAY